MKTKTYCALSVILLTLVSSGVVAQEMQGEALPLVDLNKDGSVTKEEFSSQMDVLFEGMDTNGDGQLENSEVGTFVNDELFEAADTNNNGRISRNEFKAQTQKDFDQADQDGNGLLD